jgi:hypothetical protein
LNRQNLETLSKREYTRGLILCTQRQYIQSLGLISCMTPQSYSDIVKECEGTLTPLLSLAEIQIEGGEQAQRHLRPLLTPEFCLSSWSDFSLPENSPVFPTIFRFCNFFTLITLSVFLNVRFNEIFVHLQIFHQVNLPCLLQ